MNQRLMKYNQCFWISSSPKWNYGLSPGSSARSSDNHIRSLVALTSMSYTLKLKSPLLSLFILFLQGVAISFRKCAVNAQPFFQSTN